MCALHIWATVDSLPVVPGKKNSTVEVSLAIKS